MQPAAALPDDVAHVVREERPVEPVQTVLQDRPDQGYERHHGEREAERHREGEQAVGRVTPAFDAARPDVDHDRVDDHGRTDEQDEAAAGGEREHERDRRRAAEDPPGGEARQGRLCSPVSPTRAAAAGAPGAGARPGRNLGRHQARLCSARTWWPRALWRFRSRCPSALTTSVIANRTRPVATSTLTSSPDDSGNVSAMLAAIVDGLAELIWLSVTPPETDRISATAMVSPSARPSPSSPALTMAERLNGRTAMRIISQRVAPRPNAASSSLRGVCRNTSRASALTIGRIITVSTTPTVNIVLPVGDGGPLNSGNHPT